MNKKLTIAIDGYSSCGKSTLARDLASALGYIFVDSGAMYRAVSLFVLQNRMVEHNVFDEQDLISKLDQINVMFQIVHGTPHIFLNGEDVEDRIRWSDVSNLVSHVAKIRQVREKLVDEQRKIAKDGGVVMDGRDIGTVVFPNAELKIFVNANIETRSKRRFEELKNKGIEISLSEVGQNLAERDQIDSNRKESPLVQAEDAIYFDNSNFTRESQLEWALGMVRKRLNQ